MLSATFYPSAVRRVEQLAELPADWNGHGAVQIPAESRQAAIDLLADVWSQCGMSVSEPTVVAPTSDGGVALEWIVRKGSAERGIEVVCFPDHYEYSVRDRSTGALEEDAERVYRRAVVLNAIKPFVAYHDVISR